MSKVPKYGMVYDWPSTLLRIEGKKVVDTSETRVIKIDDELKLSVHGLWEVETYTERIDCFNYDSKAEGSRFTIPVDLKKNVLKYWKSCLPNVFKEDQEFWEYSFRKHKEHHEDQEDFIEYLNTFLKLRKSLKLDTFYKTIFLDKGLETNSYPIRATALSCQIQKLVGMFPIIKAYHDPDEGVLYFQGLCFLFDEDLNPIDWDVQDNRLYVACKPSDKLHY